MNAPWQPGSPWMMHPTRVTDDLIALAADDGVSVQWRRLERHHGLYVHSRRLIVLAHGLTQRQEVSVLGHEIGHARAGDDGPCDPGRERRAWECAARLLIDPGDYAAAESVYGTHPGHLAIRLGVTREVVEAWQRAADEGRCWTRA